ncbi:MAG: protein kinase [Planctomycetota bacterium]
MDLKAEIAIQLGPDEQRYVLRPGETLVLGRGRDVDVHVDDRSVSRRHLKLEMRADGLYLTDLGSSNGTTLGGHTIAPNVPNLHYGEESLFVGEVPVTIRMLGKDESARRIFALTFLPPEEFEVIGLAGRGGLSTVWAARQKLLGREVAIKVLSAVSDPEGEDYQRFLREARLYTRVVSPYIVQLYDVRLSEDTPYLILELIRGPSARARVERDKPMPIPEALKVGEEIALALAAMHEAGIVHRDIKPSNVLLTTEGVAKLADFGLAKHFSDLTITARDMGMGSLPYVAPEQAKSAREAGPPADIYGLGATLYHLLTGRPPLIFEPEENLLLRLERIRHEAPDRLRELRPSAPAELDDLLARLLAKEPADRLRPASAVAELLRSIRERRYPAWSGRTYFGDETWAG